MKQIYFNARRSLKVREGLWLHIVVGPAHTWKLFEDAGR